MSEWKEITLGDISQDIMYGYTASAKQEPVGPKFLRITDIASSRLEWNAVPYCEISENDRKKYKLNAGDIIIARTGATTGATYTMNPRDPEDVVFASYLIRYRINPFIADPFFIDFCLRSSAWKSYVEGISGGSAQPGANAKQLATFEILLPPLPEQKAIAAVFSSLDDKIDLLHRQNKTLEAMAETLFRQWFIEEAQEDWEEGTLGDEFDFTMGQSPSGSSFNEEGIGVPMFQGNADFGFRFPEERVYTTEPTRFTKQFDTLISVRAPVGAQNMAHKACCIGRGVAAFRYKKNSRLYTYTYFKLRSLMEEIKKFNDEGTVFGSISKSDFEVLSVTIPPNELIEKYEQEASPVNDKVISNCEQIQTLEKLRDTLLPKLMSGEVRVTDETELNRQTEKAA